MGVKKEHIGLDAGASVVREAYGVVYAPGRRRDRFPQSCVHTVASAEEALREADPAAHRFPAVVLGPSRSSEGQMLYYLVRWLEKEQGGGKG